MPSSSLAPAHRALLLDALVLRVLFGRFCQEVRGHQSSDSVDFSQVETVVVHVAVYVDDLPGGERQFLLQLEGKKETGRDFETEQNQQRNKLKSVCSKFRFY